MPIEPGFEAVRDAFERNFTEHGDVGASLCVYVDGRTVVDLHGGVADPATGRPWTDETIVLTYSTTKGASTLCTLMLVERGLLDLDAPVASYWPDFAQNGKADIPVRWVLAHSAGVPALDPVPSLDDLIAVEPVVRAIEAQAPVWEPGKEHGYHALTFGTMLGEIVRRVTGVSLGTFFAREVAAPLGLEFWIGLPSSEHHRVAAIVPMDPIDLDTLPEPLRSMAAELVHPDSLTMRALFRLDIGRQLNVPEVWSTEIPAGNGVGNARSLARMYAAMIGEVDGVRLLRRETVDAACETQSRGPDRILAVESHYGLGFGLPSVGNPIGGPGCFGHGGAGGSLSFADRDTGIAFSYVMNRMSREAPDPRTRGPIDAVYASVAEPV